MKKFTLVAILFSFFQTEAQVKVPQPSAKALVEQAVGLTQVKVDYTRPAKRGRTIFGDLVPYGKLWRTGANENTKISFSEDVVIEGKTLPKGEYALYSIPQVGEWKIYFYKDTNNWGLPAKWDESKIVLEATADVMPFFDREFFTIDITPTADNNKGAIVIHWDRSVATLPFETFTHQQAMQSIETNLVSGKGTSTDYYQAGTYLLTTNQNLPKSLEYIDKAISMEKDAPFYMLRQKSLALAKLGKRKEAIKTAEESLRKAELAGNADYIKLNTDSINQWKKIR